MTQRYSCDMKHVSEMKLSIDEMHTIQVVLEQRAENTTPAMKEYLDGLADKFKQEIIDRIDTVDAIRKHGMERKV